MTRMLWSAVICTVALLGICFGLWLAGGLAWRLGSELGDVFHATGESGREAEFGAPLGEGGMR
jgi:hypothetical protein